MLKSAFALIGFKAYLWVFEEILAPNWERGWLYDNVDFFDDVTGKALDHDRAVEARRLEIEFFRKMKVYTKCRREECWKATGKEPIKTRW